MTGARVSDAWDEWRARVNLDEYHVRWQQMEQRGEASHGEADFIESLHPTSVLDAGCGMGRVAIELHRRGIDVEGADLDNDLLAYARTDAPHITWHFADLATASLGRTYQLIAMPGNVMLFCRAEARTKIVANLASHLSDYGLLVAGFSLRTDAEALTLNDYDAACAAVDLELVDRYATWERAPFEGSDYAVSVHKRRAITFKHSVSSAPSKIDSTRASTK
ncbi:MAG: methyltransferase domain-containing protein [Ilumatobacteraceae bacterium]